MGTVTKTIGTGVGSAGPGTVSTVGTTSVVGVGSTFLSTFAVPGTIGIAGVTYDIATITDNFHLTTTQTQGTNTAVAYTVGLRHYSRLQTWEDALPANLVTDGNAQVGQCFNDSEFLSSGALLTISGETTDTTNTITLTTGTGQSFLDNANAQTNALKYNVSNGVGIRASGGYVNAITVSSDNVTISKLQISAITTSSNCVNKNSVNNLKLWQCIFDGGNSSVFFAGTQTGFVADNCTFISNTVSSDAFTGNGCNGNVYKCTFIRPTNQTAAGTGLNVGYSTYNLTDCLIFGFTTPVKLSGSGAAPTISYCGTDQNVTTLNSSTGSIGSLTPSTEIVQPNATTGLDCKAKAGGSGLNAGTTIGDAFDIVGTVRPQGAAYDMGCWELVVSAANRVVKFAGEWGGFAGTSGGFAG